MFCTLTLISMHPVVRVLLGVLMLLIALFYIPFVEYSLVLLGDLPEATMTDVFLVQIWFGKPWLALSAGMAFGLVALALDWRCMPVAIPGLSASKWCIATKQALR